MMPPDHWLFALLIGAAIVTGFSFSSWSRWLDDRFALSSAFDLTLVALFGGLIGARLVSVALDWQSFVDYPQDVWRIWYGGLDWHGAVLGGLTAAWWWARWRQLDFASWLDSVSLALPFLFMAIWLAGREIGFGQGIASDDLPDMVVGFLPDSAGNIERRIEVQLAGILLGLGQLWLAVYLFIQQRASGRRFWVVLTALTASMLLLGPLMEQVFRWWLDVPILLLAIKNSLASRHRRGSIKNLSTNS
ncbi:MAG: prolipoprotein diacylglyceryl transferase [Chloroflexi bacterium]|nr:prolipoprotein diacylglyceryl transferase [Chloroflexota bacterium]